MLTKPSARRSISCRISADGTPQTCNINTRTPPDNQATMKSERIIPGGSRKRNNLQFSYAWGLQNEKEMQSTYDLSGNVPFLIDSLSNHRNSRTIKHAFSLNYSHDGENWKAYGGLTGTLQRRSLNQDDGKQIIDTTGIFFRVDAHLLCPIQQE